MNRPDDGDSNLAAALRALPHGPEFRFVDRVLTLDPGREGTAEYRVRGDEPCLRGHFPGQPMFPGVLLVEAAAQLAGIVAQTDPRIGPLEDLKLTAIRNAKITASAVPGETLLIRARVSGRFGPLIQAEAEVLVDDRPVLTAVLALSGNAPPNTGSPPLRTPAPEPGPSPSPDAPLPCS